MTSKRITRTRTQARLHSTRQILPVVAVPGGALVDLWYLWANAIVCKQSAEMRPGARKTCHCGARSIGLQCFQLEQSLRCRSRSRRHSPRSSGFFPRWNGSAIWSRLRVVPSRRWRIVPQHISRADEAGSGRSSIPDRRAVVSGSRRLQQHAGTNSVFA